MDVAKGRAHVQMYVMEGGAILLLFFFCLKSNGMHKKIEEFWAVVL